MSQLTGHVVQVIGPVVDVAFAKGSKDLPAIHDALEVVKGEGKDKNYNRTYVETGLSDGVNIEIKKGLTDKDKVRGPEIISDEDTEN